MVHYHQWLLHARIGLYCNTIHANTCTMYWHMHTLYTMACGCIVVCIGGIYWIHTSLVVCIEYILACIQYLQACIQYIPVCIGMYCVRITYILNCNTCKYRLNTDYNTCHNTWQIHSTRIGMYCNTCQKNTSIYWHVLRWYMVCMK